jgi:hypothetical protein
MPSNEPILPRTSRRKSATARRNAHPLPASVILIAGFAIVVTIIALVILPAHPGRSWVANATNAMIWISIFAIPGCLIPGALYLWHADFRALVQHFGFMRMGMFSLAILLPPALALFAYGILLLQGLALWNRLLFAIICGPLVAGGVLAVIAHLAGNLAIKDIQEYFGFASLEQPNAHPSQSAQPPDPRP